MSTSPTRANSTRRGGHTRHETEHKSFGQPDETREFPNGRAEILSIGGAGVGRMTFQPGWRWSNDRKPIAGTDSCEAPHFQYHVSGQLAIRMDGGTEVIAKPGDITSLPRGTTRGSWATNLWWSSTGTGRATTPRRAEVAPRLG
jgi:hypothetical protein